MACDSAENTKCYMLWGRLNEKDKHPYREEIGVLEVAKDAAADAVKELEDAGFQCAPVNE